MTATVREMLVKRVSESSVSGENGDDLEKNKEKILA